MDRVACDGCGRSFVTLNGKAIVAEITGRCPNCGGTFAVDVPSGHPQRPRWRREKRKPAEDRLLSA